MAIFGRTGEVQVVPIQPSDIIEKLDLRADIETLLNCVLLKKKLSKKQITYFESKYPEIVNKIIAIKVLSNSDKKWGTDRNVNFAY